MTRTRQAIAALIVALAGLPMAGNAIAQDDEPIVNDYSNMGVEYGGSDDAASGNEGGDASAGSDQTADNGNAGTEDGELYNVNCDGEGPCKVSKNVMVGFDKYGQHCAQCHAQNAEGSTFAPSLVNRLQGMGQGRFTAAVAGGVTRMDSTTGQYSVMPAWNNNEDVMSNMQQLWAFLKARSDGALPAGRPQVMDDNG